MGAGASAPPPGHGVCLINAASGGVTWRGAEWSQTPVGLREQHSCCVVFVCVSCTTCTACTACCTAGAAAGALTALTNALLLSSRIARGVVIIACEVSASM
jgi:hypothetical protein